MKKIIATALILLILSASAIAEIDISGFSYAELMELKNAVQREIISRPEWKEVTVPAGQWEIGVDIPAGAYAIKMSGKRGGNLLVWGKEKNDYKTNGGLLVNTSLGSDRPEIGKLVLKDGNVLEIKCEVIMTPVKGLGF